MKTVGTGCGIEDEPAPLLDEKEGTPPSVAAIGSLPPRRAAFQEQNGLAAKRRKGRKMSDSFSLRLLCLFAANTPDSIREIRVIRG